MKELKDYQRKAINELRELFDVDINHSGRTIVFKAPTGSGKTYVLTKLLEEICTDPKYEDEQIAFIWASIGKGNLNEQSYNSVKKELAGYPECVLLDRSYLDSNDYIQDKQIVFVNWEKLVQKYSGNGNWKNSLMRDQEGNSFINLIDNTKNNGTKLCLIVDESHIGKSTDTSISQFRDKIIDPNVTIEMSATPTGNPDVVVTLHDAREEGMVKEDVIINKLIDDENIVDPDSVDSMTLVLSLAEEQRKKLVENFKKVGSNVNPLVLVQVPNTEQGDDIIKVVEDFLETKDITYENGLLVKWLNGEEKNFDTERIKKNDSIIEYMIFKTVVDTGWDCPRAHILVKFREVKSETSIKQTLGRIVRTPEAKKYYNYELDNAYVFTNMAYVNLLDLEYEPNHVKDIRVKVKDGVDKSIPPLRSFFKSRVKSYNAADPRIYGIIENEFCEYFGIKESDVFTDDILQEKGLKIDNIDRTSILSEMVISTEELETITRIEGGDLPTIDVASSQEEIRGKVMQLISENLNGLARARSLSPIESGLKETIQKHISGLTKSNVYSFTLQLISNNEEIFGEIISRSTIEFKKQYPDMNLSGSYSEEPFEINDEMAYSSATYKELHCILSLYDSMYVLKQGTSQLEEDFTNELDLHYRDVIEWVWHNGSEPNEVNFGVEIDPDLPAFRPDYLIKFKDGRFGIFDTKSSGGFNIEDTRKKAKALYKYIHEDETECPGVFGGIIVRHYGDYYINQNEEYKSYDEDPGAFTNIKSIFWP